MTVFFQGANKPPSPTGSSKVDLQFLAIRIINTMTKTEETWLPQHPTVVTNLLKIWVSESFQDRHRKVVRAKLMNIIPISNYLGKIRDEQIRNISCSLYISG